METLPSFSLDLLKDDVLMSWDIKGGYRHMYLHPMYSIYLYFATTDTTIDELRCRLSGAGPFCVSRK